KCRLVRSDLSRSLALLIFSETLDELIRHLPALAPCKLIHARFIAVADSISRDDVALLLRFPPVQHIPRDDYHRSSTFRVKSWAVVELVITASALMKPYPSFPCFWIERRICVRIDGFRRSTSISSFTISGLHLPKLDDFLRDWF